MHSQNTGEVAEWSNAAVLKTVVLRGTGGSNPSFSAKWLKKAILTVSSVALELKSPFRGVFLLTFSQNQPR